MVKQEFLGNFSKPDLKYFPKARYWLPEAYLSEQFLRKDIKDIKKRGFSGVEVVPMAINHQIYTNPENYWGTKHWFDCVEVILDEAQNQQMTVDFAISLQWPISMPNIHSADDHSTLYELTFGSQILTDSGYYKGPIPERRIVREEGKSRLVKVMAYQINSDNQLLDETFIDLTNEVQETTIEYRFPATANRWILFSFWEQPTAQKVNGYYVIDHLSEHGVRKCEDFWLENMKPIIDKYPEQCESIFCDSLEYNVSQDWTRGFLKIFEDKKSYNLSRYLPGLALQNVYPATDSPNFQFENKELQETVLFDYYDVLTQLYNEQHLIPLNKMAHKLGMSLRYQVAYNKAFEVESSATSVDIPEGEALNRCTIDNLKMMSGAVHSGNKPIYSYECSAEFGNAYGQKYEDLLWWVKRGYIGGMNSQVIHGVTYNGPLPQYDWPGYEPFRRYVSNSWNRTLSIEGSFVNMEYIARINSMMCLNAVVDLAIIRESYINDGKGSDGDHLVKDGGKLFSNGFNYDFLSPEVINQFGIQIKQQRLYPEGPQYKAVIYPVGPYHSSKMQDCLVKLAEANFAVYILVDTDKKVCPVLEKLQEYQSVQFVESYEELILLLKKDKIEPNCQFANETEIVAVHTKQNEDDFFCLYNYNQVKVEEIDGKLKFMASSIQPKLDKELEFSKKKLRLIVPDNKKIIQLVPETGDIFQLMPLTIDNKKIIDLDFEEDELKIIGYITANDTIATAPLPKGKKVKKIIKAYKVESFSVKIDSNQERAFYDYDWQVQSETKQNKLVEKVEYSYSLALEEIPDQIELRFDGKFDTCIVEINGSRLPLVSRPNQYRVALSQFIEQENEIKIILYDNLYNRLNNQTADICLNSTDIDIELTYSKELSATSVEESD